MPVLTEAPPLSRRPIEQGRQVVLPDISWETYEAVLRDLGECPLRMTYDRGSLEIMPLSFGHEELSALIGLR